MTVDQRPETHEDEAFLRKLILDTIAEELGAEAWPEPMRGQLLDMQYRGRRFAHRQSCSRILRADGLDVGWLAVASLPHEVRILDFMVAREMRGHGIGSSALRAVLADAEREGKPVRLHVNVTNTAAIRFYGRLGFRRTDGDEVQHAMEREVSWV